MASIPVDEDVLSCGCIIRRTIENGENTLTMIPCNQTCRYYLYVLDESAKRGNRIERRAAP